LNTSLRAFSVPPIRPGSTGAIRQILEGLEGMSGERVADQAGRLDRFPFALTPGDACERAVLDALVTWMRMVMYGDMTDAPFRPWSRLAREILASESEYRPLARQRLMDQVYLQESWNVAQTHLERWYPRVLDLFGPTEGRTSGTA
jgi:hypothetical protein